MHPKTPDGVDSLQPDTVAAAVTAVRHAAPGLPRLRFGEGYGPGEYVASDEQGDALSPEPADVPLGQAARRTSRSRGCACTTPVTPAPR